MEQVFDAICASQQRREEDRSARRKGNSISCGSEGWGRGGRGRAAEEEGGPPGEREGRRERGVAAGGEGG